jgi:hypothetical protein
MLSTATSGHVVTIGIDDPVEFVNLALSETEPRPLATNAS